MPGAQALDAVPAECQGGGGGGVAVRPASRPECAVWAGCAVTAALTPLDGELRRGGSSAPPQHLPSAPCAGWREPRVWSWPGALGRSGAGLELPGAGGAVLGPDAPSCGFPALDSGQSPGHRVQGDTCASRTKQLFSVAPLG